MQHITTEQALQIPQQLKRNGSQTGSESAPSSQPQQAEGKKGILRDDAVTLQRLGPKYSGKQVEVGAFKGELGKDQSFISETLKNKLSEYGLNPNTRISVKRNEMGLVEVSGSIMRSDIDRINLDLNNSTLFKDAFTRVSQNQPTLDYVDNVKKLSSAYGVNNSVFDSLLSEDAEFNQLNDIRHRYEMIQVNQQAASHNAQYEFVLNDFN